MLKAFSIVAVSALFASGTANAATMVETTSIESPSRSLSNDLFSQNFPLFNPANGKLTSVQETVTGTATWTSSGGALDAFLDPDNIAAQIFAVPGTITFNMSGMASDSATLTDFTGTGSGLVDLLLLIASSATGTFATNGTGLTDTITYTFTPPTATPLPAALPLFATGLGALGLFGWRRKRKAHGLQLSTP